MSKENISNRDLKEIYDKGDLDFHSGFEESLMLISMIPGWQGLNVLEIGCGEGHLCSILSYAGAKIEGIDYAEQQIKRAQARYPAGDFYAGDYHKVASEVPYNVVVMQGVLEHFGCPWDDLSWIMDNLLDSSGSCLLSVPNWVNPRGFIYHTLRLLFDAKMSLTDLHYFLPDDFEVWNNDKYHIEMKSCDYSWAAGPEMFNDLYSRIPKAIKESEFDLEGLDRPAELHNFLSYAKRMAELTTLGPLSGANLGVLIRKEPIK